MAAENVGGVEYYADVDTSGVLQGGKVINRSVDRATKDFQRLDTQVSKTSKGVKRGLGGMGRNAGQAGIQMQQFIGQVQGGQSAMLALSQQGADLGFVLGAPLLGAIVGIGASLAGMLAPSMLETTSAAEKLEETMKTLGETAKETDSGIYELTEEVRELAKVSQAAALAKLQSAMFDAEEAAKAAANAIQDSFDSLDVGYGLSSISDYENALDFSVQTSEGFKETARELGEELGFTGDKANEAGKEILLAISQVKKTPSAENFERLRDSFSQFVNESGNASDSIKGIVGDVLNYAEQARKAAETNDKLKQSQEDLNGELERSSESSKQATSSLNELVAGLVQQANTVGMSERELAKWTATQLNATEGQLKNIDVLYDYIEGKEQEAETDKKAEQEKQKLIKRYETLTAKMKEQYAVVVEGKDPFEMQIAQYREAAIAAGASADEIQRHIAMMRELKTEQENQKANKFTDPFEGVESLGGQGEDFLSENQMKQLEQKRQHNEAMKQLEEDATETVKQNEQRRNQYRSMALGSAGNLFGAMADLLKNSEGEQSGAYKAMFALSKGFAIAQASLNLSLALSQALADPTALTLPQKFANYAAIASSAGSLVSSISGASMGGGRLYGGETAPGKLYPITEDGRPEILTEGNKRYLLPGSRGNVTSNRDMQGMGGSTVNIDIINNASGMVSVSPSSSERDGQTDIKFVIDAVRNDILEGGKTYDAIKQRTNAGTKTG